MTPGWPTAPGEEFRRLHLEGPPLLLVNAWDYASAALLVENGFTALGTTSLGVAGAAGKPDAAGATSAETLALGRALTRLPALVSVDIENGFSDDPAAVADLVVELAASGVVGINLEDGRPDGSLRPASEQCAILRAVRAAAPGLFINARTDTYWLGAKQEPVTETIARGHRYREAGADGVFVPGVSDASTIATLVSTVDAPLNVLFTPAGPDLAQLAELGVRRVSTGSLLFRAALGAAVDAALAASGAPATAGVPSYRDVEDLIGKYPGHT